MPGPPPPANPAGHNTSRWFFTLALGGLAVVAVAFTGVRFSGDINALIHRPPSIEGSFKPRAEASIVLAGSGSRHGDPFYLTGGTYRFAWAAWGPAAEYPPCTHSAELMAVDPANATTSSGHVADLARLVHVPAAGTSDERYIANLKSGDYYFDVASDCGWQIAISPSS